MKILCQRWIKNTTMLQSMIEYMPRSIAQRYLKESNKDLLKVAGLKNLVDRISIKYLEIIGIENMEESLYQLLRNDEQNNFHPSLMTYFKNLDRSELDKLITKFENLVYENEPNLLVDNDPHDNQPNFLITIYQKI